jgi:regulator of protease activity HflC (stomatin/prohibitin superfamily)
VNSLFESLINVLQRIKIWTTIQPWQRGVRVRLGKHTQLLEPGLHFRIPLLDTVATVNTRLRIAAFPSQTITASDGRPVTIAGNVGFRIDDPFKVLMALSHPEASCSAYAQAAAARWVASRAVADVTVSEFEVQALDDVRAAIPGVVFEFVTVTDFACVKTIRLLQEEWRPNTGYSDLGDTTR